MKDLLQSLNEAQKRAVTSTAKHILVSAGAGSGKTRVLTSRILWLIEEQKIPAQNILALTFTNKAAEEMRQRVQMTSPRASQVMLTTFHSFGAWFLRHYGLYVSFPKYFSIYDDEESVTLLKRLLPQEPTSILKSKYQQIQRCKDGALGLQEQSDLSLLFGQFNAALRANKAVDFGDLIYLPQHFLSHNASLKQVVQNCWQAILVDEYQDTNHTQTKLLSQMIGENTSVLVVGDEDQSIYGFRGAEPSNMLDFAKKFSPCEIIKLEENYRSTSSILACANTLIAHNTGRLEKNLYSCYPDAGKKPQIVILNNQDLEAAYVCQLLQENPQPQTAILYRVNAQSRALETALLRAQIPYTLLGSVQFYQREEIKTTLAWLTFLINPYDEASFGRIIRRPSQGIGGKSLQIILETRTQDNSILSAMTQAQNLLTKRAAKSCSRLKQLFTKWQADLDTQPTLVDFFGLFLEESGLNSYYAQQDSVEQTERLNNIKELLTVLKKYESGKVGLARFLEEVALVQQPEHPQKQNDKAQVTLMTVHNAKGLEYERVILVGMEQELFPWETIDPDEVEEERRLCYVAITRAKKELYMLLTKHRSLYGHSMFRHPSQFLHEMGQENFQLFVAQQEQPSPKSSLRQFQTGDWVKHAEYGIGRITKSSVIGQHCAIEVQFENGRKAKFLPEFAKLELISPPSSDY